MALDVPFSQENQFQQELVPLLGPKHAHPEVTRILKVSLLSRDAIDFLFFGHPGQV